MNCMVELAGVGAAIGLSIALALGLEWLTLRGLMLLMPAETGPSPRANGAAARRLP